MPSSKLKLTKTWSISKGSKILKLKTNLENTNKWWLKKVFMQVLSVEKSTIKLWQSLKEDSKTGCLEAESEWSSNAGDMPLSSRRLSCYVWRASLPSQWSLRVSSTLSTSPRRSFTPTKFREFSISYLLNKRSTTALLLLLDGNWPY